MRLHQEITTPAVIWGYAPRQHRMSPSQSAWRRRSAGTCAAVYPAQPEDGIYAIMEHAANRSQSISINPEIMEGQPCITGTRIPVRSVIRAVENSGSIDGAVLCYPHLTVQHVKDALYFAQIVLEWPSGADKVTAIDR